MYVAPLACQPSDVAAYAAGTALPCPFDPVNYPQCVISEDIAVRSGILLSSAIHAHNVNVATTGTQIVLYSLCTQTTKMNLHGKVCDERQ